MTIPVLVILPCATLFLFIAPLQEAGAIPSVGLESLKSLLPSSPSGGLEAAKALPYQSRKKRDVLVSTATLEIPDVTDVVEVVDVNGIYGQDDTEFRLLNKRGSWGLGNVYTPKYCEKLGYKCGHLSPYEQVLCLQNCANKNTTNEPYANFMPKIIQYLCSTVNTEYMKLPDKFKSTAGGKRVYSGKRFVDLFNLKESEKQDLIPKLAKEAANALIVAWIKGNTDKENDIYHFKPLISKLELQSTSEKSGRAMSFSDLTSLLTEFTESGLFVNKNCGSANLDGEAILLSEILKKKACLVDILIPGYYFFKQAPVIASKRRILPLLKGFNNILFLLTGVKCCLISYKTDGQVRKCGFKLNLLTGPPPDPDFNQPSWVCGSVPHYQLPTSPISPGGEGGNNNSPGSDEKGGGGGGCEEDRDLYTDEYDGPCEPKAPPPDETVYTNEDFSSKEEGGSDGLGGRIGFTVNQESEVEAAYGDNAPDDDEFFADRNT